MNYLIKVIVMVTGKLWAEPLVAAFAAIPADLPFEQEQKAVIDAIQSVKDMPGTLRKWLCAPVKAAKSSQALAVFVSGLLELIDKYL